MGKLVRDLMRRDVISIPQTASIWELSRLLTERGISGVPVVDAQGEVVGVVSRADIVRCMQDLPRRRFQENGFYVEDDEIPPSAFVRVADIMNRAVISAPSTTTVSEFSRLMLAHRIHRILIIDGRKLVGIVTTSDILKTM